MPSCVTRREGSRPNPTLELAMQLLRKGDKAAKQAEPEAKPAPAKEAAAKKKPAAKKTTAKKGRKA